MWENVKRQESFLSVLGLIQEHNYSITTYDGRVELFCVDTFIINI